MSYLLPTQIEQWANPQDVARAYEQLLKAASDTADRAHLLAKQVAQLRNENQRLLAQVNPLHRCSRCGGDDQCPAGVAA